MDIVLTVAGAARDDMLKRAVDSLSELGSEADDVTLEKDIRRFTQYISRLSEILQELRVKQLDQVPPMRDALHILEPHVEKARDLIKSYNSASRLHLLLNCRTMLSQLQHSAADIATGLRLIPLANLDATLHLTSRMVSLISDTESLQFRTAVNTEAIVSDIQKSIAQNGRDREQMMKLVRKILEAVGASPDALLVRREIELLKREMEELEERKQQAEDLQLLQLTNLLHDLNTTPTRETPESSSSQQSLLSSITCPLSGEMMDEPVAVSCGHSFEKKAIQEHFARGERSCPVCEKDLLSLDVTFNISLCNSIQWLKQRKEQEKLQNALSSIMSGEPNMLDQSLEDLCTAMENIDCIDYVVDQQGLVSNLVGLLRMGTNDVNVKLATKCLCYLARHSKENKEVIAKSGGIRYIVKQFCRGEIEVEAVEILLELSQIEGLAERIGNINDSIPSLVSLLQNPNPNISQKAQKVLDNISFNTQFVIKMAECRHFGPFLTHFHTGHSVTRATMAKALTEMQLSEMNAQHFESEQFISELSKTVYSTTPAWKSQCLRCIRKLTAFNRLAKQFLADRDIIPALLGIMSPIGSEHPWKEEAIEILISLVQASQPYDCQMNPTLQELHSEHNIHVFLQLASTSTPKIKSTSLQLLLTIVQKSEIAQSQILSDPNAMICLLSILQGDHQSEARLRTLNLIHCIIKNHPAGIPLLASTKESIVTALITTFTSSPNNDERSVAAAIIGQLPLNDATVNDMLRKSEVLKAIHQVITGAVDDHRGMTQQPLSATSSSCLLENALEVLLRYTEPTKPELQEQVAWIKLYPSLIRVLSTGSSLAKQRSALSLAFLFQSTNLSTRTAADREHQLSDLVPLQRFTGLLRIKSWCCWSSTSFHKSLCSVHGSTCSFQHAFCLIRNNAVRPLVQLLRETEYGAADAALTALDTLLLDDDMLSAAITEIMECQGMDVILHVMERGSVSVQDKALDICLKILKHSQIRDKTQLQHLKSILINQHLQVDALKKKAGLVLGEMGVIPQQSSYF